MSNEIERKFLVDEAPRWLSDHAHEKIDQGYLAASEEAEVRIRIVDDRPLLTVKRGHGEVREEVETDLVHAQREALWPLTEPARVEKTRYEVPLRDADASADVDVYAGDLDGLVTAEVEFASREEADRFRPPDWFGREITGDDRYANQTLAAKGRPADE